MLKDCRARPARAPSPRLIESLEASAVRAISLFTGAGGMDVGFSAAGIDPIMACEMNPDAAATYRANHAAQIHVGDVRELIPHLEEGMAECIFGGPPCQGFSIAGKMDPTDTRSELVHSFLDAVEMVRPGVFVMENVDALAALAKWAGTLSDIRLRAADLGYATCVRVLNAADFGVPQSRRRMFMWGVRGGVEADLAEACDAAIAGLRRPIVTTRQVFAKLGPAGTERNPATCPARITFARNPVMRASQFAGMLFNGAGRPVNPDAPAPTIAASSGGNKTHIVDEAELFGGEESFVSAYHRSLVHGGEVGSGEAPARLRRLTIEECRAFQTFPEGYVFKGRKSAAYRQIGNAVPCDLARVAAEAAKAALATVADLDRLAA